MITRVASLFLTLLFLSMECHATISYFLFPVKFQVTEGLYVGNPNLRNRVEGGPEDLVDDRSMPTKLLSVSFDRKQKVYLGYSLEDPINSPSNDFFHFTVDNGVLEKDLSAEFSFDIVGGFENDDLVLNLNDESRFKLDLSKQESSTIKFQVPLRFLLRGSNKLGVHKFGERGMALTNLKVSLVTRNESLALSPEQAVIENKILFKGSTSSNIPVPFGNVLLSGTYPSIPKGLQNSVEGAPAFEVNINDAPKTEQVEIRLNTVANAADIKEDLRLFYFDPVGLNWIDFLPDTVYQAQESPVLIVEASLSFSGTYFVGTKSSPASSEGSLNLNTSLSELSNPNPFEGYGSISPPQINQSGSASTGFAFNLPPGRNGLGLQLGASYNSELKNGLLGVGWNIPISSIDVDLKWGVPRFGQSLETEVYTLDGESLSMESGFKGNRRDANGNIAARTGGTVSFFPKIRKEWQKIERKGNGTGDYFWVVTSKDQSKLFFGTKDGLTLDNASIVKNDDDNIVSWKLTRVQDKWGNYVDYEYEVFEADIPTQPLLDNAKQTLPVKIRYTGFESSTKNLAPPYLVEFNYDNSYRSDARVAYNAAFKSGSFKKLNSLKVSYDPDPLNAGDEEEIRSYHFHYKNGDFNKMLLQKIEEKVNGESFYEQTFEYFENSFSFYSTPVTIPRPASDIDEALLGESSSIAFNLGGLAGAGVVATVDASAVMKSLSNSIFGFYNYGKAYNYGRSTITDINGDGINDLLIQGNGNSELKYYPGTLDYLGIPSFNSQAKTVESSVQGIGNNRFHYGENRTDQLGVAGVIGIATIYGHTGYSWNWNNSEVYSYQTDANGDGILDLVENGNISFGDVDPVTKTVTYRTTSSASPNPIYNTITFLPTVDNETKIETEVVRSWRAHRDGAVTIENFINLNSQSIDGVRYAIEKISGGQNIVLAGFNTLNAGQTVNPQTLNSIQVSKNDLILFRLITKENGRHDLSSWNPKVTYSSFNFQNADDVDFGTNYASDGFILSAADGVSLEDKSTVHLFFNDLTIPAQSDTVVFAIQIKTFSGNTINEYEYKEVIEPNGTAQMLSLSDFSLNTFNGLINGSGVDFSSFDLARVWFKVESPSNVNWQDLDWRPILSDKTQADISEASFINYPLVEKGMFSRVHTIESSKALSTILPSGQNTFKILPSINFGLVADYYSQAATTNPISFNLKVKSEHSLLRTYRVELSANPLAIKIKDCNVPQVERENWAQCANPLFILDRSTFDATQQNLFFSACTNEPLLADLISQYANFQFESVIITQDDGNTLYDCSGLAQNGVPSSYSNAVSGLFGPEYLGWGQFGWNGIETPIDPAKMTFGTDANGNSINANDLQNLNASNLQGLANQFGLNPDLAQNPFRPLSGQRGEYESKEYFLPLGPLTSKQQDAFLHPFQGFARITRSSASLARLGEQPSESQIQLANQPAGSQDKNAPVLKVKAYNTSFNAGGGASFAPSGGVPSNIQLGAGLSYLSNTDTKDNDKGNQVTESFLDINADGYPDKLFLNKTLGRLEVMQTDAMGGDRARSTFGYGIHMRRNDFESSGLNGELMVDGGLTFSSASLTNQTLSGGLSLGGLANESSFVEGLIDINGDGLPDLLDQSPLQEDPPQPGRVAMHTGKTIVPGNWISFGQKLNAHYVEGGSFGGGLGVGGSGNTGLDPAEIAGVGGSLTVNWQNQEVKGLFRDINADGLVDLIYYDKAGSEYRYFLNEGTRFIPSYGVLSHFSDNSKAQNLQLGVKGDYQFVIPLPPSPIWPKIVIGARAGGSIGSFSQESTFRDMNADGYPDHVVEKSNGDLEVYFCAVKKSNLLKTINNAQGSTISLDYKRVGNKYGFYQRDLLNHQNKPYDSENEVYWDMPYSKWVLSTIALNDGFDEYSPNLNDGSDIISYTFLYDGGVHDRREREFLGFSRIAVLSDMYNVQNLYNGKAFNPESPTGDLGVSAKLTGNENLHYLSIQQYPEPTSSDFQERIKHRYIAGLVQKSYQIAFLDRDLEGPSLAGYIMPSGQERRSHMMEVRNYEYDYHEWFMAETENDRIDLNTINLEDANEFNFNAISETNCIYPELKATETISYIDTTAPGFVGKFQSRRIEFSYNRLGLLKRAVINGSDGPGTESWNEIVRNESGGIYQRVYTPDYRVDLIALFHYYNPIDAASRVGQISRYRLFKNDTVSASSLLMQSTVDLLNANGLAPEKTGVDNGAGVFSFTEYSYTENGSLASAKLPANHKGDVKRVLINYDTQHEQFPVEQIIRYELQDGSQWDEVSHYVTDPQTALLNKVVDPNGQATELYYDDFYRPHKIFGPRELNNPSAPYTLAFKYWDGDLSQGPAWAMSKQYLGSTSNETELGANPSSQPVNLNLTANLSQSEPSWNSQLLRRSATLVDGFGRVLQNQLEVSIEGASQNANVKGRRISGPLGFDNFGKLSFQYGSIATSDYPQESDLYTLEVTRFENRMPATISHIDPFGRLALVYTLSDYSDQVEQYYTKTEQDFGWGRMPHSPAKLVPFGDLITYGHEKMQERVYYDYFGHVQALVKGAANDLSITQYTNDPIGQLLSSINPAGISTTYQYDRKGRLTQEAHADRGQTTFTYDLADNVLSSDFSGTANGAVFQHQINYQYEYDRLLTKTYPVSTKMNNLELEYGRPGQAGNSLGRVRKVKQGEPGAYVLQEQFRYTNMGQIAREERIVAVPQMGEQRLVTDYVYDSWGRVQHMRYPDGEKLQYHYAPGGDLEKIETSARFIDTDNPSYYLEYVGFDGFGQPLEKRLGNGTKANFTYNDLTGSLETYALLSSSENSHFSAKQLLDKNYQYDATGNISQVQNLAPALDLNYNKLGGSYSFNYSYDEFNQLHTAQGLWNGDGAQQWNYSLNFSYDANGRITQKTQAVTDAAAVKHGTADYDFSYQYNDPAKNALSEIDAGPTKNYQFNYNAFGSLNEILVNNKSELSHLYDEEQRLRGSLKKDELQHNVYDPYGIRLMKAEMISNNIYQNGEIIGSEVNLQPYLVNAGPHYLFQVFENVVRVSKHYYGVAGSRIASRVLSENRVPEGYEEPNMEEPGGEIPADPGGEAGSGGSFFNHFNPDDPGELRSYSPPRTNNVVLNEGLRNLMRDFGKLHWYDFETLNERLVYFSLAYGGDACAYLSGPEPMDPSNFQIYYCECINDPIQAQEAGRDCDLFPELYWYHSDGLGNVEYLTDLAGMPYEYFWYAPTGEMLEHQQQSNAGYSSPYQFSARTYDVLPNLVYMGARFYSPIFSIFTSVDPLSAYRSWISPYNYVQNNPVMRQDPTGMMDVGPGGPGENDTDIDGWSTEGLNLLEEVTVVPGMAQVGPDFWVIEWLGVTYLFNKAEVKAGIGVGFQGVSQKGVAYDEAGVTHFHFIAKHKVDAIESRKTESTSGIMGSWTYGFKQDYSHETFYSSILEEGASFSAGAALGLAGGFEFGDGFIGADVGFGLGFTVDCGVTEVKESISVTDAQADVINSEMGGGNGKTWSIDRKTIRFNEEGGYYEANVSARTTNKVTTEIVVRSYGRKVWMSKEYIEQAIKIENQ